MSNKAIRAWHIVLGVVLALAGPCRDLWSDVLVTTTGKRWPGKVTVAGDYYLVTKADGGTIRLPKGMVKEVLTTESVRRQFDRMVRTADLSDDAQVAKLAAFANQNALKDERRQMLSSAGRLRWAKAKDSPKGLRELSKWCNQYRLAQQASACQKRAKQLEFEGMLRLADLSHDFQVASLAAFADKSGLTDEKKQMLSSAGRLRWGKAKDSSEALRALSEWCRDYELEQQASACEKRANDLEFEQKWPAARADPVRLEELATWCKARKMTSEVRKCLAAQYNERKEKAGTPEAIWEVAEWCEKWEVAQWTADQRITAIQTAESLKDLGALQGFLQLLESNELTLLRKKQPLPKCLPACRRAIYNLRREAADNATDTKAKASALAELWAWCQQRTLSAEAKACADAALAAAPEDPEIRQKFGYARDAKSGKWVRFESSLGIYMGSKRKRSVVVLRGLADENVESPAPAGKQYVILHFLACGVRIGPYQGKHYVLSRPSGGDYVPQGVCFFGPDRFSRDILGAGSIMSVRPFKPAIYFEVPDPSGPLVLKYKGKRVLELQE